MANMDNPITANALAYAACNDTTFDLNVFAPRQTYNIQDPEWQIPVLIILVELGDA